MTARARFRESDIKRAIAGARAAGLTVGRVEIRHDGSIVIMSAASSRTIDASNPWDQELRP